MDNAKIAGVYIIRSSIKPNRVYIGSSDDIIRRWRMHLSELKRRKHHSIILQNHVNKYGISDITFNVIIECDVNELIKKEQLYIDSYNPYFNIRKVADSNRGIKRSEQTKGKIREKNIGKVLSIETKEKMSNSKIGNKYSLNRLPVNAKRVIDIKTNVIYESAVQASLLRGIKRSTLQMQLSGINRNGTTLRYLSDVCRT